MQIDGVGYGLADRTIRGDGGHLKLNCLLGIDASDGIGIRRSGQSGRGDGPGPLVDGCLYRIGDTSACIGVLIDSRIPDESDRLAVYYVVVLPADGICAGDGGDLRLTGRNPQVYRNPDRRSDCRTIDVFGIQKQGERLIIAGLFCIGLQVGKPDIRPGGIITGTPDGHPDIFITAYRFAVMNGYAGRHSANR